MNAPKTLPAPLADAPLISDWITRGENGTFLVLSGRVELGQGNMTAILQMAADELDMPVSAMEITGADTTRTPNEGFTAGSLSIAAGGMAVRYAASAARQRLLSRAAELTQCAPSDLSVDAGHVFRNGDETGLDLWSLAGDVDLAVPVAEYAAPKPTAERRLCGATLPRIDLLDRAIGHPFVHDIRLDAMLDGRPVHPPAMSMRLQSVDIDALAARPGVVEVVRNGSFLGIVAETEIAAISAARWARSNAEWSTPAEAPSDVRKHIVEADGEIDEVFRKGAPEEITGNVVETLVTKPYLAHGSIGPSAAVALWDKGRLKLWTHAQGVYPLRQAMADVFGIEPDAIDAVHVAGAGCYGHNGADDVALDAALLANAVPGRPVRVVWSRQDELSHAPLGPAMATRVRAVLNPGGRIEAMTVVANSAPHGNRPGRNGAPNLRAAAYLDPPFPVPRSADIPPASGGGADRNATPGYDIPHLSIAKRLVHDLPYRTSSMRGLGAFANIYALETLMDAAAEAAGADPVAFRLDHLSDPRARAVIEAVAGDARAIVNAPPEEGVGWGIAFARYKNTAAYCAIVARIEVGDDVRVTDVLAAIDVGEAINPGGVIAQTEGGIIQSISWTLKEEAPVAGGYVGAKSWLDYPILKFSEVPNVKVRVIDRPEDPPLGCAEAAQGPMAAALGNAVRRALGVGVAELPITREAIIRALSA